MSSWFGGGSSQAQAYDSFQSNSHQASASHELLSGAASYEAAKAYEEHCAREGKPASHAEAKEILAGLVGGIVDREVETKGLDFVDKEKAKREARRQVHEAYDNNGGEF